MTNRGLRRQTIKPNNAGISIEVNSCRKIEVVDQNAVAVDWHARGFSCDLWVDPPGQVWADFVHSTDELVLVVDGEVEFQFGGEKFIPAPGKELLIPAGTTHTVRNLGKFESRWLYGYKR